MLIDYAFGQCFDGIERSNFSDIFTERLNLPPTDLPGFDLNYIASGVLTYLLLELPEMTQAKKLYTLLVSLTQPNWSKFLPDVSVDDLAQLYDDIHHGIMSDEQMQQIVKLTNNFPDPLDREITQEQLPDGLLLDDVVELIDELLVD